MPFPSLAENKWQSFSANHPVTKSTSYPQKLPPMPISSLVLNYLLPYFIMAQTALITGASAGIGWELAKRFAANKTDLVLVARNEQKLQTLAAELQQSFGIRVQVLVKDLGRLGAAQ